MTVSDDPADPLRLSLVTVGDPNQPTGGYRYHRIMADAAPGNGAEIRFVSIPSAGPVGSLAAGSTLRNASIGSDGVLLDSIAAAAAAPWLRRRPFVAIVHQRPGGAGGGQVPARLRMGLDRFAYRRAAGAIVAADGLVQELRRSGVPSDRIRVVHPGCEVPVADGPPLDLRRGRGAAVLCVANWTPTKGILELLDAFGATPHEAATLWLVGSHDVDRAYTARVRERMRSPDLWNRVMAPGALPIEEVGRFYRAADLFAMCSTVDAYGTAWAEALAAGLPVVGWRTANLPLLAEDGREALTPLPGDVRSLADALGAITTDAALRNRLADGARRRALTLPTWEGSAERFFAGVRELLGERRREERAEVATDASGTAVG